MIVIISIILFHNKAKYFHWKLYLVGYSRILHQYIKLWIMGRIRMVENVGKAE